MTEEIIINDVNVAGCNEFLEPDGCDSTNCASFQCDKNPNCYYKQLKRLEQENKELKEYSQRMENQRENYYKEYNNYRSALEEIREDIKYFYGTEDSSNDYKLVAMIDKINEVLNENN